MIFKRKTPDEHMAKCLAKMLERDWKQESPQLHIKDWRVQRLLHSGHVEVEISISAYAKLP
jgi:hypothetical protein